MSYIPANMNSLTPYFTLEPGTSVEFVEFLIQAFDAEVTMMHKKENGQIKHAELNVVGTVVEVGELGPKGKPSRMTLHAFVPDADATYQKALDAGATSVYEMATHDYGERSGGVRDRWGNDWYLATVIDHELRSK